MVVVELLVGRFQQGKLGYGFEACYVCLSVLGLEAGPGCLGFCIFPGFTEPNDLAAAYDPPSYADLSRRLPLPSREGLGLASGGRRASVECISSAK